MHPYLAKQLADDRIAQFHRDAEARRWNSHAIVPGRSRSVHSVREHAGWALIEAGIRIAGGPSDRPAVLSARR